MLKNNKSLLTLVLACTFWQVESTQSAAATMHVIQDGTGNYTNIQAALDHAHPGDTITVHTGTYHERITTKTNGTSSAYITLKAENDVLMYGFNITNDYIQVDGFEITQEDAIVSADALAGITSDTSGLFQHLVAKSFINHSGVIQTTFLEVMTLTGSPTLNLSATYSNANNAIYGILAHAQEAIEFPGINVAGDHAELVNNHIHHIKGKAGIESAWRTRSFFTHVVGNFIEFSQKGIILYGNDWLVESNEVTRLVHYFPNKQYADADYSRFFGENHIIRNNYFHGSFREEVKDAHVDGFQTFDHSQIDKYRYATNVLIVNNIVMHFNQGLMAEGLYLQKTSDIIVRNNIFAHGGVPSLDGTPGLTGTGFIIKDTPRVTIANNTFYDIPGQAVFFSTVKNALTQYGVIKNNIIAKVGVDLEGISYNVSYQHFDATHDAGTGFNLLYQTKPPYRNALWPANPSSDTLATIAVDNFVGVASNPQGLYDRLINRAYIYPDGVLHKKSLQLNDASEITDLGGVYDPFKNEVYTTLQQAIEAVDPLFVNPNDIVGPDGIPFTEDDGLRLQAGSPAIDAGENAVDMGAYAFMSAPQLPSRSFYVDFENGSDINDGHSTHTALKTAPTNLQAGDTVFFKRGQTYIGHIDLSQSGHELVSELNGVVAADGITFTATGANFLANGVTPFDKIYVNGEGFFEISAIESETQLTLASPTLHRSLNNVAFMVGRYITFTTTEWGTGNVTFDGQHTQFSGFDLSGESFIWIDGSTQHKFEITGSTSSGIYANNTTVQRGIVLRNLYIHHNNVVNAPTDLPGIYLRNTEYVLIEHSEVSDNGDGDGFGGDDGIHMTTRADFVTIQYNDIHHNKDDGIQGAPLNKSFIQFNNIHDHRGPDGHPDGIAFNAASCCMEVTVRYNHIYDNASPTDWDQVYFHVYYNLFYDTEPWADTSIGNMGIRYKNEAYGEIYNNIFAYNTLHAIFGYGDGGPVDIQNNIFWENQDMGEDIQEIVVNNVSHSVARNNIYVRQIHPKTDDKVIGWGGIQYTIEEFQVLGQGQGSLYNEPGPYFMNETRTSLDFTPAGQHAPQVDSGINLGLFFDLVGTHVPQGLTVDIGAYESAEGGGGDTTAPSTPMELHLFTP